MKQAELHRSQTAILLIAHGSRRQQANDDLILLRDMVRTTRGNQIVEHAFLELAEPTIPQGTESCVRQGAKKIILFPYFLSAGVHVVDDLNKFKTEFEEKWTEIEFIISQPLGLHRLMVDIVFDRIGEAEHI